MKSYTDLEQSKMLAEILPIESADMEYLAIKENGKLIGCVPFVKDDSEVEDSAYSHIYDRIPCWSLTALIGVMPQINEWFTPYGHKNDILYQFEPKICKIWEHNTIPSYKVTYGNRLFTDSYDNPVDACVAMVEKLHELNLL